MEWIFCPALDVVSGKARRRVSSSVHACVYASPCDIKLFAVTSPIAKEEIIED